MVDRDIITLIDKITKAVVCVHALLGSHAKESLYCSELIRELEVNRLNVKAIEPPSIYERLKSFHEDHVPSLVVEHHIAIDVETKKHVFASDLASIRHYLGANGYQAGLVINFRSPEIEKGVFIIEPDVLQTPSDKGSSSFQIM